MILDRRDKFMMKVLCAIMFSFAFICTGFAEEPSWFDTSWKHRQKITIENPDIQARQLKIEIPFQEGMRRRMQDIRFCYGDGVTPLNFFIESTIPEERAVVWIRLQDVSVKKHVYLYYGNTKGDSASSFDGTFQKLQTSKDTIGLWHFDEGEGRTIRDISGNGNDLQVEGGEIYWGENEGGQWGNNETVNFEKGSYGILPEKGEKTYLFLPPSPNLKFSGFTWEVWVRIDKDFSGPSSSIIRKGSGLPYLAINPEKYPSVWLDGCGMKVSLSPSVTSGMPRILIGKWHYLVVTLDEETLALKIYQDARLVAEKKLDSLPKENDEKVSFAGNFGQPLYGAIDEMRLSSRALTQKEIEAYYWRCSALPEEPAEITFGTPETLEY